MNQGVRKWTYLAIFIALTYVGAQIKIQGSIALDAFPAFLISGWISPVYGAVVGLMGHLLSASLAGFPLSLPIHLVVGLLMFLTCGLYGYLKRKKKSILAVSLGFLLNGPISLWVTANVMVALGMTDSAIGVITLLILPLSIGAILNIALAVGVEPLLKKHLGGQG